MITSHIQAIIFYSHSEDEIRELAQAIQSMGDHIRAVCSDSERSKLRAILQCNHFRARDAVTIRNLLKRAANHSRAHLGEYFPQMQEGVMIQAEALEDAVERYFKRFKALQAEIIPVN